MPSSLCEVSKSSLTMAVCIKLRREIRIRANDDVMTVIMAVTNPIIIARVDVTALDALASLAANLVR